ncbi:uncharacterized protein L201_005906 [Kwoniella dendrophila CBS 6074]|uniref:Uncharacterized protein n=1 Tax=Kwoniella dendrophila CBS 6074 TaxID=1295534 RepID=A0AAX4K1E8_9TREE
MRVVTALTTILLSWYITKSSAQLTSSSPLHDITAVQSFIDCVGLQVNNYRFNLDENEILVIPANTRSFASITSPNQDEILINCISQYQDHVNLVLYGSAYNDSIVSTSIELDQLIHRLMGHDVSTIPVRRRGMSGGLGRNK